METLKTGLENQNLLLNLKRVGDLVNFEGPLLTLYRDKAESLYLVEWADQDSETNRWIVYPTTRKHVLGFIKGSLSQLELFIKGTKHAVFVVDIRGEEGLINSTLLELLEIPQAYYPRQSNFFDPSDCPSLPIVEAFLSSTNEINANPQFYTPVQLFDLNNRSSPDSKQKDLAHTSNSMNVLDLDRIDIIKSPRTKYYAHAS